MEANNMKAIISNGRRSSVYTNTLDYDNISKFVASEFPRMSQVTFSFKNAEGKIIPLASNEDVETMKKLNQGQNFVEILIQGERNHHHGPHSHGHGPHGFHGFHGWHGRKSEWSQEKPKTQAERKQRRLMVLSRIFGGEPAGFETFETENKDLHMGKLIRKYSEINNIPLRQPCHKRGEGEKGIGCQGRKMKFFQKFFGENKTAEYKKFFEENKGLRFKELVQKFTQQTGETGKTDMFVFRVKKCQNREEKVLEKLSKFFQKPKEEFQNLVKEHPNERFCSLIKILESQGVEIDQSKLDQFKKERREAKNMERGNHWRGHGKGHCKGSWKNQSQSTSCEKKNRTCSKDGFSKKNDYLSQMKNIFGENNEEEYKKLINENVDNGIASIIQKWLQITKQ